MSEKKCIYCGKSNLREGDLSESDIIPDSLTNAKLRNDNVCRIEHNNLFSDHFESTVINDLAFLRNILNINGKNKTFPNYMAKLHIKGDTYTKKFSSDNDNLSDSIMSDESKSKKIGSLDKIKEIAKARDILKIEEIDFNTTEVTKEIDLNTKAFVSDEMMRLATKIAFEWVCKVNGINDYYKAFDDAIKFITTGTHFEDNTPVTMISDKSLNSAIQNISDYGSHLLMYYFDHSNHLNVIFSFWGIVLYEIKLSKTISPQQMKHHFYLQEFMLDGKKRSLSGSDLHNIDHFFRNTTVLAEINGIKLCSNEAVKCAFPIHQTIIVDNVHEYLKKIQAKIFNTEDLYEMFLSNITRIVQTSVADFKSLKRFVSDNNFDGENSFNFKSDNSKYWFLLYIVFLIGKKKLDRIDEQGVKSIVKGFLGHQHNEEFTITKELIESLKKEILSDPDYNLFIKNGSIVLLSS